MVIEILGTGCTKCKALEEAAHKAVEKIGGNHTVVKVEDIQKIVGYGVLSTPGLVVDGEVKSTGKALSVDEIINIIK